MAEPVSQILTYALDEQDRLVELDDGYFDFALENGWRGAGSSAGKELWDYVSGHTMQRLQRGLLQRIRDESRSVRLPFRCDGPAHRRQLELEITALPEKGTVRFVASPVKVEVRESPQALLEQSAQRGPEQIVMCGWCDRFEVEGNWLEVEDATGKLGLFSGADVPSISHGVCGRCAEMLLTA